MVLGPPASTFAHPVSRPRGPHVHTVTPKFLHPAHTFLLNVEPSVHNTLIRVYIWKTHRNRSLHFPSQTRTPDLSPQMPPPQLTVPPSLQLFWSKPSEACSTPVFLAQPKSHQSGNSVASAFTFRPGPDDFSPPLFLPPRPAVSRGDRRHCS